MDTSAIDLELLHRGIIDEDDQSKIAFEQNPNRKNQMLHACLMRKCTDNALKIVCDVIIGVAGIPRMKDLGKDMMKRLEAGKWCVSVFFICVCTHSQLCYLLLCRLFQLNPSAASFGHPITSQLAIHSIWCVAT